MATKPNILSIVKRTDVKFTYPHPSHNVYAQCPECNGDIVNGFMSCPDGRLGCLVAHYGHGCLDCKTVFNIKFDLPKQIAPMTWKVYEEIGQGIINSIAFDKLRKF